MPTDITRTITSGKIENKRVKEIRELLTATPEDEIILYVDEVDIHLNPKIGRDWMPSCVQKMVLTPGKKQEALSGRSIGCSNR